MFIPRPRRRPTRYLEIRPNPVQLPGAGYLGYGQGPSTMDGRVIEGVTKCFQDASETRAGRGGRLPIAAPHSDAENVGEYNGWVSMAKGVMVDLGIEHVDNTIDEIDSAFTDGVHAFQEEYAELYDLEPTGWLDPKTVKALQTVYSQVYGSVPPLVPIYPTGEGLMVGYPAKEKGGKSIAGPLIGIGLCAAVAVFAGVMITR